MRFRTGDFIALVALGKFTTSLLALSTRTYTLGILLKL